MVVVAPFQLHYGIEFFSIILSYPILFYPILLFSITFCSTKSGELMGWMNHQCVIPQLGHFLDALIKYLNMKVLQIFFTLSLPTQLLPPSPPVMVQRPWGTAAGANYETGCHGNQLKARSSV